MDEFKNNMENKIKDSLKSSAENINIPDGISPENIKEKLRENEAKCLHDQKIGEERKATKVEHFHKHEMKAKSKETEAEPLHDREIKAERKEIELEHFHGKGNAKTKKKPSWKSKKAMGFLATAAVFVLIFAATIRFQNIDEISSTNSDSKNTSSDAKADLESDLEQDLDKTENASSNAKHASKKIAASSTLSKYYYNTTYDDIKKQVKKVWSKSLGDSIAYDEDNVSSSETAQMTADSQATSSYSTTNLQVEGVDEGDIVKTDGSSFYILNTDNQIRIVDAKTLEKIATISNEIDESEIHYSEMYVSDHRLILAGTIYKSSLKKQGKNFYYMDSKSQTVLLTYDISNPKKPKLLGTIYQDGTYRTSRKIGDYVYLFSDYSCYPDKDIPYDSSDSGTKSTAIEDEEKNTSTDDSIIPTVNQTAISEDCIFIPREISSCHYLVISSVNLKEPSKTLDETSIMQSGEDFHITKESIYILQTDWSSNQTKTNIIRFSFQKGIISPVDVASLSGRLTDTFALNESNSYLRVLLTDWSSDSSTQTNSVYVLNPQMKTVGKIKNLAPGETIYSARFMGNIGYFVTYQNTDPLFSVDFSDPENPKIIGELKITGFSEYLHFYGKDKLFGIGRETDPNTGEFLGIKLSMFDISNPKKVTEKKKIVLKGVDDCEALDDYKAILIDEEKNLIGFAVQKYKNGIYNLEYLVFSYNDKDGFVKKLDYGFTQDFYSIYDKTRGLYIDSVFYIIRESEIISFDRKTNTETFKLLKKVKLNG